MSDILTNPSQYGRSYIRNYIFKNNILEYKCDKCKMSDVWQNEKITLQLDHINGDFRDNKIENLHWLCPNCHSQQQTSNRIKNRKRIFLYEDDIINLAKQSNSIRQILFKLGFSDASANYNKIKVVLEKNNLNYVHNSDFKVKTRVDRHQPRLNLRKVERPTKEELQKIVWELSILDIAKKYSMSPSGIVKWIKDASVTTPPKGYWTRRFYGYSHEESLKLQNKKLGM
jgi:hypothetical protein